MSNPVDEALKKIKLECDTLKENYDKQLKESKSAEQLSKNTEIQKKALQDLLKKCREANTKLSSLKGEIEENKKKNEKLIQEREKIKKELDYETQRSKCCELYGVVQRLNNTFNLASDWQEFTRSAHPLKPVYEKVSYNPSTSCYVVTFKQHFITLRDASLLSLNQEFLKLLPEEERTTLVLEHPNLAQEE